MAEHLLLVGRLLWMMLSLLVWRLNMSVDPNLHRGRMPTYDKSLSSTTKPDDHMQAVY